MRRTSIDQSKRYGMVDQQELNMRRQGLNRNMKIDSDHVTLNQSEFDQL